MSVGSIASQSILHSVGNKIRIANTRLNQPLFESMSISVRFNKFVFRHQKLQQIQTWSSKLMKNCFKISFKASTPYSSLPTIDSFSLLNTSQHSKTLSQNMIWFLAWYLMIIMDPLKPNLIQVLSCPHKESVDCFNSNQKNYQAVYQ